MTLENEFLELDPDAYEKTLRAYAKIAATNARALGITIPSASQAVLDAAEGSLAAEKATADLERRKALQQAVADIGLADADNSVESGEQPHSSNYLSNFEALILKESLLGRSTTSISRDLSISQGTVNLHLARIRSKYLQETRVPSSRDRLIAQAIQDGLIRVEEATSSE